MASIHRIVLRRLITAWVIVSFLIGGIAYYIETEKIDEAIVALAASQATDFAPEGLDTGKHSQEELARLSGQAEDFVRKNFVVIELYDRDKKRIIEAVNPKYEHIENQLKQYKHKFPLDNSNHYEKYFIGEDTVVQVLVPLPSKLGGNAGFFEGVFVVDRNTLEDFRRQLWHTLGAVLIAVLATSFLLYPVIISLNRDVLRFSQEVLKGNLEMASVLGAAIAKRDSDTGDHNFRVTLYAIKLGEAVGLDANAMRQLIHGAFLHDVGKIGISDNILLKPGKLSDEEFAIMRTHVALGVDIIAKSDWLQGAREVIEGHHEKFDGKGYLRGLKGEEIPLNARIFAIVDVFDALTSRRPYKEPMSLDTALGIIQKDAGTHFDPKLVTTFLEIAPAMHASIGSAGESELSKQLRTQAMHYFLQASIAAGKT
jgi:HD-GYP domain-containing protein (c-di-GMP phosphodiesterase class II)